MSVLPQFLLSLGIAFGGAGQVAAQSDPQLPIPDHGYKNFITTLKTLCQTHKHILLGDTDHGSLEIMQLTANPEVLKAIKSCGSTLVHERETEQNEGYKLSRFETDPVRQTASIKEVQSYLAQGELKNLPVTGKWDDLTPLALQLFISKQQQAARLPADGIYTEALGQIILKKNPATAKFVEALAYLEDQKVLPIRPTLKTMYQEIQLSAGGLMPLQENADYAQKMGWLQYAEVYHAAKLNLPIIYPDYRQTKLADDPKAQAMLNKVISGDGDKSDAGGIYTEVKLMAELARDPKIRPPFVKLMAIVDESRTAASNQIIADNALRLLQGSPSVIKYGSGHMAMENDLDEMFPNSVTILLKARPDQKTPCTLSKTFQDTCKDAPQYVYDIESDTMTKVEKGTVSEQAYTGMLRYGYTRAEYDAAVKRLPADLKRFVPPHSEFDSDPNNNVLPANWLQTKKVYTFRYTFR